MIFFNICNTNVQTKSLSFSDFLRIFGEAFNLKTESAGGAFKVRLAVVEVVGCRPVEKSDKDHPGAPSDIDGWYAWEFGENFDVLIPKPVRGSVNFFNIPDEEIESAPDGKFWYDYL